MELLWEGKAVVRINVEGELVLTSTSSGTSCRKCITATLVYGKSEDPSEINY